MCSIQWSSCFQRSPAAQREVFFGNVLQSGYYKERIDVPADLFVVVVAPSGTQVGMNGCGLHHHTKYTSVQCRCVGIPSPRGRCLVWLGFRLSVPCPAAYFTTRPSIVFILFFRTERLRVCVCMSCIYQALLFLPHSAAVVRVSLLFFFSLWRSREEIDFKAQEAVGVGSRLYVLPVCD